MALAPTNPTKGPPVTNHTGKGSQEEMLPSRHARTQLTSGDPAQRSIGQYAKKTPGLGDQSPSIMTMGFRRGGLC